MPMIPKPMTDINSESAYEKLKFIPEHYNEIMAAYTDIMEHLKLPVGGSGEECLHEVVEVTNPCPAYVQFDLNINIPFTGIHFVYKDNSGDYNIREIYDYDTNGVSSGLRDILNYLSIPDPYHSGLQAIPILPAPSNTDLVYAAMLVDKITGEPVEDVDIHTDIDGISGDETTYTDLTNAYGVKLVLADPHNYSAVPTILGDLLEKIVELRSNADIDAHKAKLPTPEELLRILQVRCNNDYNSNNNINAKLDIVLLTPEERAKVRSNLHMNTSDSIPEDAEYMYAINLFCHPKTLNEHHKVSFNCMGGYSKGFIGFNAEGLYGLMDNGCADYGSVTYRRIPLNLTPVIYSGSYEYFILPDSYSYNDNSAADSGVTVTPYTFKLIQSKEGIDRRL
jgi:hypothetical protein